MAGSVRSGLCLLSAAALLLAGCGGRHQTAPRPVTFAPAPAAPTPPAEADFVAYPTCMLYLTGTDARLRVRAKHTRGICHRLAERLNTPRSRWSPRPRRAEQILSPICRMANAQATIELDVIDDATGARHGPQLCTTLAHAGWYDISPP
jgi:hypothetical protein